MTRIGVVGLGVVGLAVKHGLERIGHAVFGHDLKIDTTIRDVIATELVFVCVPTPQRDDGACDVSRVESVVAELDAEDYRGVVAIKSTVTPGTTMRLAKKYPRLRLAFCPEFLRERAAYTDFVENHDVCVIGTSYASDFETIRDAHGPLPKHVVQLTWTEAELAKYFSNALNALRVVFANSFYEVCTELHADYGAIKDAMVKRATIEDVYLDCNERFRGFGGVCLPKDTAALAALVRELGLDLQLFEMIVAENRKFVATVPEGMRSA